MSNLENNSYIMDENVNLGNYKIDQEAIINREKAKIAIERMPTKDKIQYARNLENSQDKPTKIIGKDAEGKPIEISTADLSFIVAESMQKLYAEIGIDAEYRDWIEDEIKISNHTSDGHISEEDQGEKDQYLHNFVDRETEMKTCIALYASSALHCKGAFREKALDRYKTMTDKLGELRRLRAKVQSTKNRSSADEKKEERFENSFKKTAEELYISKKIGLDAQGLEDGVADEMVQFRPVSYSQEEARKKIMALRNGAQYNPNKKTEGKQRVGTRELSVKSTFLDRFREARGAA